MKKSIIAVAITGAIFVANLATAQEKGKHSAAPAKTEAKVAKTPEKAAEPKSKKAAATKTETGGKPAKEQKATAPKK